MNERTMKAKWFLDKSDFSISYINYVYENTLDDLGMPEFEIDLLPFKEMSLTEYQQMYYECSIGDPQVDWKNLTPKELFEKDKRENSELVG